MILRKKSAHLVLETSLAVMRPLVLDVSHQLSDVGRTDRKQPVSALPRKFPHPLLLHPRGRSRFDLRHNFRRRLCGRQTQCQMDVIWHAAGTKAFAIEFSGRTRQVRVQRFGNFVRDQSLTVFGAENDVHEIEEGLRHARDYMSGFQPSLRLVIGSLGLRPRLVCRRAFGPYITGSIDRTARQKRMRVTRHTLFGQTLEFSESLSPEKTPQRLSASSMSQFPSSTFTTRVPQ